MAGEVFWESYSLGDGFREKSEQTWPILKKSTEISTYIRDEQDNRLNTPEGEWVIDASANHRVSTTLPDGRMFSTIAADRGKIPRVKQLSVTFEPNRPKGELVCEGSTSYVIKNAKTSEKQSQFAGVFRSVRHAEVRLDTGEGRTLPEEEKIFLVYSAR